MSGYADPSLALKEPVPAEGVNVPLLASFVGVANVPFLSLGKNNLSALLRFYPDGVETKVFRTRRRPYSNIRRVEVQTTLATRNVEFVWADSRLTFTGNIKTDPWRIALLRFLDSRGVPLSDAARSLITTPA